MKGFPWGEIETSSEAGDVQDRMDELSRKESLTPDEESEYDELEQLLWEWEEKLREEGCS